MGAYSSLPSRILEADVAGINEAFGNLTERGATDPVVKATVRLSESGFVSVPDAVAFGDISDSSFAGMNASPHDLLPNLTRIFL